MPDVAIFCCFFTYRTRTNVGGYVRFFYVINEYNHGHLSIIWYIWRSFRQLREKQFTKSYKPCFFLKYTKKVRHYFMNINIHILSSVHLSAKSVAAKLSLGTRNKIDTNYNKTLMDNIPGHAKKIIYQTYIF